MSKKSNGWGKFLLGAAIGGTLGVLFAPKKGSETREDLVNLFNDLVVKVKEIDVKEVRDSFLQKIDDIKNDLQELDSEKVKEIALDRVALIKIKCEELVVLAKEKGTPVIEKMAMETRKKAIAVTKDVLKKLEDNE